MADYRGREIDASAEALENKGCTSDNVHYENLLESSKQAPATLQQGSQDSVVSDEWNVTRLEGLRRIGLYHDVEDPVVASPELRARLEASRALPSAISLRLAADRGLKIAQVRLDSERLEFAIGLSDEASVAKLEKEVAWREAELCQLHGLQQNGHVIAWREVRLHRKQSVAARAGHSATSDTLRPYAYALASARRTFRNQMVMVDQLARELEGEKRYQLGIVS